LMALASVMAKSSNGNLRELREKSQGESCLKILEWPWHIGIQRAFIAGMGGENLELSLPTIKLFCSTCNRNETFNTLEPRTDSILNHTTAKHKSEIKTQQVLVLEYECQYCKGLPSVFMIRRDGMKISLEGRSPIEYVEVPKVIPKGQAKYFSGAIVAHNSGQTLAGLFLLRTFIEQYVRNVAADPASYVVDDLFKKYMETLPQDFKDRFTSLYKIYTDLSAAIHNADASEDLFDQTITDLKEHFEAKRLYKIKN